MLCFHSVNEIPALVLSAGLFLGADSNCNGFCLIAFFVVVVGGLSTNFKDSGFGSIALYSSQTESLLSVVGMKEK